ncbi:hypothetical protein Mar181_2401 [Marinomonas posidonica IVIA-Po-181]|uniref:Uncharacterized protein n=1 Tax=Marinomonas posidonica (strain CECT 7376 / NCIMB 14433 / IVIA-Po-181) TaxID=491952 RepID=F6CW75_MARPP|nr:hypothetical protein Mar181_2401 [Marinomonas posidonica IVIA-Po-181]
MKNLFYFVLLINLVGLQASCTTKGVYEALQDNHQNYCQQYRGQQQDDCQSTYRQSYEEYQHQWEISP